MTNTLPVHRLDLQPGARADAPAAYVRALTLTAGRLNQVYERIPDEAAPGDTTTPLPLSASPPALATTTAAWWSTIPALRSGPAAPGSRLLPAQSGS